MQSHTLLYDRVSLAAPQATTGHPLQVVASECGDPGGIICEGVSIFLGLQHINAARSSLKDDQDLLPQASSTRLVAYICYNLSKLTIMSYVRYDLVLRC